MTAAFQRFVVWGFSYGGNVGRYLAARSERVAGMAIIGIPFGPGASGAFRASIERMRDHWTPILQAQRDKTLDWKALSQEDRAALQERNPALTLAWLTAMLEWPTLTPEGLRRPTLWLIGSANAPAMASLEEHRAALPSTPVRARVIDGLTHPQEFTETDRVLPTLVEFTQAVWSGLAY